MAMSGAEIKERLIKLTTTNTSDERDERLIATILKMVKIPAQVTCGMVFIEGERVTIQTAAKMLCKQLKLPL